MIRYVYFWSSVNLLIDTLSFVLFLSRFLVATVCLWANFTCRSDKYKTKSDNFPSLTPLDLDMINPDCSLTHECHVHCVALSVTVHCRWSTRPDVYLGWKGVSGRGLGISRL